ncbi:helix-turn-helix transcriptional regulator [Undibacterium sp.]|uniref:helix-turn-helix transcriptional regulator n=1 Tax=Undibacterium sp. TaxID=1914977 RepID=UPI00374D0441
MECKDGEVSAGAGVKVLIAADGRDGKVMLITPDRVAYAGLLGQPQTREFGSLAVYVSLGSPFQLRVGNGNWESAEIRVIAPDTPHQIRTTDRLIASIMIEAESICMDKLPHFLQVSSAPESAALMAASLRNAFAALMDGSVPAELIRANFDQFFFGETLAPRSMEPRMAKVVNAIKSQPCDTQGAEDFAALVDLSFSRFLHLFKNEVGTTFRRFRAWKRARSFLSYVNTDLNLTDIALETGYPDSSHFSHSIRRVWGLTPKNIVAGSRRLAVIMDGDPFVPASYWQQQLPAS